MAQVCASAIPTFQAYRAGARAVPFSLRTRFKTFTGMAVLKVGPTQECFMIHRELLTHHSPFFAAALNGTFAEGLSQTIELPEERLDIFELFVYWLYTQMLDQIFFKDSKPAYYTLLHLYALADRLAVERLRNQTLDQIAELAEQTNSVLTPSDTFILCESIREGAPLRRLMLDLFAFKKTDKLLAEHPDDWHPGFLRDLVVYLKRPGVSAMARHALQPWKPASWQVTRACDECAKVLQPGFPASVCPGCGRAFCAKCVGSGKGMATFEAGPEICRPWKGSRCRLYHEHDETESCSERGVPAAGGAMR